MGRRKRNKDGFNTPFADLEVELPPPEPVAPEPKREAPLSEEALFAQAMQGVERIDDGAGRVEPAKREVACLPDDEQEALLELTALVDGKGAFRLFESSEEVHSGMAPGVNFELLDKLRNGAFSFRRHLDLHGMSRDEAKPALVGFVANARRDGERCVLVVTGRGRGSPDGVSVLREILPRWLSRSPLRSHVLAFCTAQQVDGGPGATYVLLRRAGVRPYGAGA